MVSLFNSLNIASNALSVNESAISVVSHNVANMNTEGYSKQKVNLATRNIAGSIGDNVQSQIRANGGVMIANVTRNNDDYLNSYYQQQNSVLSKYTEQLDCLDDLAAIFDDLEGSGIDNALSDFYAAVNNLNEYPASSTARTNFIESAKTLTSTLNAKSKQLDELTTKVLGDGVSDDVLSNSKIYSSVGTFNDKLSELAEINKALQVTQTGTLEANNLLDKRDAILTEISEYVDFDTTESTNGSVNLYVGGTALVRGSEVKGTLSVMTADKYCNTHDPGTWTGQAAVVSFVDTEGTEIVANANTVLTEGSLGGMIHSADVGTGTITAGDAKAGLDSIAQTVADVFNNLNTRTNAYCIDSSDTTKLKATTANNYIFVNGSGLSTPVTAGDIQINDSLLSDNGCWDIACAYFDDPNDYDINAVGNAQNVAEMLKSRSDQQSSLGNMSIEDYYTSLVGKVATSGSNLETLCDTQQDVVDSIYNKITANNSVDLNEELVDLVKYQTAYSASAQVFNVTNACLDTLMSLGG